MKSKQDDDRKPLKVEVKEAVRALRGSLHESQQAFATRLGISIRALANYEKGRLPSGKALLKMMGLAAEGCHEDWLASFRRAAIYQLETDTFELLDKASGSRELLLRLHQTVMELF